MTARFPTLAIPPLRPGLTATVHVIPKSVDPLPGLNLVVLLGNGYGLSLIHGRGRSGARTAEAMTVAHNGDPDAAVAMHIPTLMTAGRTIEPSADTEWITTALATLAALPARY